MFRVGQYITLKSTSFCNKRNASPMFPYVSYVVKELRFISSPTSSRPTEMR